MDSLREEFGVAPSSPGWIALVAAAAAGFALALGPGRAHDAREARPTV